MIFDEKSFERETTERGGAMRNRACAVAVSVVVLSGVGFGQVGDGPVKTTICELVKEPARFNGMMVQFRATVATGPESIVVEDKSCSADIWLSMGEKSPSPAREFAYIENIMDIRTPERLDWKPLPPLRAVVLKTDRAFRRFDSYVSRQCRSKGAKSAFFHCPIFSVSATLTGRFDYSDGKMIAIRPTISGTVGGGAIRYGHLGAWNSQLVLESVTDVTAQPMDRSPQQ